MPVDNMIDKTFAQRLRMARKYGHVLTPDEIKDLKGKDPNTFPPAAYFRAKKVFERPSLDEGFDEVVTHNKKCAFTSAKFLGDEYVNKTLENIQKDDPMAIYKSMQPVDMFLAITLNNVRVSFLAFALGVVFSVGTGYVLFTNGVMLCLFGLTQAASLLTWISTKNEMQILCS